MKLVTQVRYSVRILLDLAMHQSNGVVQMSDIAARQNISLKYLEQLIRPIKDAGFVTSKRGRKGGHCLARNPEKITLAQIIRIFEKEYEPVEPVKDSQGYSQYQDSLIREAWDEAREAFYSRLEKVTLADLSIDTTKKLWRNSDLLIFG
ncbi:MAG: Rrf2 family transcriptional regulator, partial [Proteobacteria bacterium]|nr:Rrf2 family transcriptional regulator [Pseudomonadota bacterium]MBU1586067.1 Rrf2 family transcriptional regulator [Pseudomonadota bacterium]MBU2629765.1 Rrf2 family transcriptional regulator [Pseudomonadota bacterium]